MSGDLESWYIVKHPQGHCEIRASSQFSPLPEVEFWGPFDTVETAIARRIGLIRAGKCQPVQVHTDP
uniref:DDE transposase family protein n=1 Tax=Cyanothece sp. (strain PCC 7425 / ATCC 29141) TaxID=395961 RepID=B8HSI8_CYAP4